MVKLIALDLDGTLLDPSGAVTPGTKAAIAAARAAGLRVVLNTGRPIPEAIHFSRTAGCDDLISCLGGAALVDGRTGEVLLRHDIAEPAGTRAVELCLGREIELMLFAGNEILVEPFSRASLLRTYPFPAFHNNAIPVDDPVAYMKAHGLPLTKIHGDWNPGNYPLEELAALPGVQLTAASPHDFELVADGVDKGRMLAELAGRYGITPAECAAVGDSDNDLAMLRAAGTPIAMGNASDPVKTLACRVVAPNSADGVAEAIRFCME